MPSGRPSCRSSGTSGSGSAARSPHWAPSRPGGAPWGAHPAKKLRYALEALEFVDPEHDEGQKEWAGLVALLQDELGELHDTVSREAWLRRVAGGGQAPLVAGQLLERNRVRRRSCWPAGLGLEEAASQAPAGFPVRLVRSLRWPGGVVRSDPGHRRGSPVSEQVDVVVVGLGPGGEDLAGRWPRQGSTSSPSMPSWWAASAPTGAVSLQDDDPRRQPPGRGPADRGHGRHCHGQRRLGAGGRADPQGGDRHLGRHGRRRPTDRARARFVRGWAHLDGPGRVVVDGQAFEATKASCSTPGPGAGRRRSPGSRARRTGRTARPSRPRRCPVP